MIQTILCLSDTHNRHRSLRHLPEADVLVHCGDFTEHGTEEEALDFLNWLCDLPYRHKLFTIGNHDVCLHGAQVEGLDANCHFLCHTGVTLEGLRFYGIPFFMEGWDDRQVCAIPSDVDVLVSHQPPLGVLDEDAVEGMPIHYGSEVLWEQVLETKPRYHLFGHVHAAYGTLRWSGISFANGALLCENGSLRPPLLLPVHHSDPFALPALHGGCQGGVQPGCRPRDRAALVRVGADENHLPLLRPAQGRIRGVVKKEKGKRQYENYKSIRRYITTHSRGNA